MIGRTVDMTQELRWPLSDQSPSERGGGIHTLNLLGFGSVAHQTEGIRVRVLPSVVQGFLGTVDGVNFVNLFEWNPSGSGSV